MDLSQLSDEELMAIASGQQSDLSGMSDAELEVIANQKPLTQPGQPAAADDPMGVGASGVDMLTEYGAEQARRHSMQGPSFGYGEEIESALTGTPIEQIRGEMGQYAKERPGSAMAAEITGAVVNPLTVVAPAARPLLQAFAGGTLYGSGKAEGDATERFKEGLKTGAIAVPFTWGLQKAIQLPTRALASRAAMADEKMTAEALQTAAKQAYKEADLAGSFMDPNQTMSLARRAKLSLGGEVDFNPKTHKLANAALDLFENRQGKEMSFAALDEMRQGLWNLYNQAGSKQKAFDQKYIMKLINQVDDEFDNMPFGKGPLLNAREAYKQAQKASSLDAAIKKANLEAASSGSGGNVANRYLNAVKKMLGDKNQLKYFTPQEIAVMEQFVKTGAGGRFQRSLAKLAPNGNGLMLALHAFSAAAVDPATLTAAGVGMAAQASSERQVQRGVQEIMDVFGGKVPQRQPISGVPVIPGAYGAEEMKKKAGL
jgi:hypothetical protein